MENVQTQMDDLDIIDVVTPKSGNAGRHYPVFKHGEWLEFCQFFGIDKCAPTRMPSTAATWLLHMINGGAVNNRTNGYSYRIIKTKMP